MTEIIAQAAGQADSMVSGNWIIGVIGALASAGALILGKMQGRKEAQRTTLESPVPEIPTRKGFTPPSWDAHVALCDRVTRQEAISNEMRHDLSEVRKDMANQYRELIQAGQERERNISDKLEGVARGIHHRIDEAINHKSNRP